MQRIRTIKPEFFKHHALFRAEAETGLPLRVAFAGLWTCADREGRFKWKPAELKLDCLPYDDVDFARALDALAARGFVTKYTSSSREYGYIPSWKNHQVINNREKDSVLPEPDKEAARVNDTSATRGARDTDLHERKGKEGNGNGNGKEGKTASLREAHSPAGDAPEKALNGDLKEESPIEAPPDAESTRKILFNEGLQTLVDLSGRRELACRGHLGLLLKTIDDDAAKVMAAIRAAQAQPQPLADAFAWIMAAVQQRAEKRGSMALIREKLAERAKAEQAKAGKADIPAAQKQAPHGEQAA